MIEVSEDVIQAIPDGRAALRMCLLYSGKQPKAAAHSLHISPSSLTRMLNPDQENPLHFPPELIDPFMTFCGNEIPLRWLNWRRGYPFPQSVTALQAENAALRAELAELRGELERHRGEKRQIINVFKNLEVK